MLVRLVLAGLGFALIASVVLDSADAGVDPTEATLTVRLSPPVPSQISVDGIPRDTWSLTHMDLEPGVHTVSYSDVPGFVTPPDVVVSLTVGQHLTLTSDFLEATNLRVTTSPPVDAYIWLDEQRADQWGLWTNVTAGPHLVCFGPVAGFVPPPCENLDTTGQSFVELVGTYTPQAGAAGVVGDGRLRVVTDPPVPATILVDGRPRSDWGLTWLSLPPGEYEVSFTDVPGFSTPGPETVTVTSDFTTTVTGDYEPLTQLRVILDPPVPMTVVVDGISRNRWGMWTGFPNGTYEVCLEGTIQWEAPPCEAVTLNGTPVDLIMTPTPRAQYLSGPISATIHPLSGPASGPNTFRIDFDDNVLHRVVNVVSDGGSHWAFCLGDPMQTYCSIVAPMSPPAQAPSPVWVRIDGGPLQSIGTVGP